MSDEKLDLKDLKAPFMRRLLKMDALASKLEEVIFKDIENLNMEDLDNIQRASGKFQLILEEYQNLIQLLHGNANFLRMVESLEQKERLEKDKKLKPGDESSYETDELYHFLKNMKPETVQLLTQIMKNERLDSDESGSELPH